PAVQKVREAAARTQCLNNLKQIALGLHNYHDVNKRFPSGHQVVNGNYFSNWAIFLLPFIEQDNLYKQYDNTVLNSNAKNKLVRETFLPVYTCPADLNGNMILIPETAADISVPFMTGSYRGMSGVCCDGFDQWAGYVSEVQTNLKVCPTK